MVFGDQNEFVKTIFEEIWHGKQCDQETQAGTCLR